MTQHLRDHLITTAARLIEQRGGAGIGVRDIAREAQVADGVLYNYFADKEDLLANALLAHVGSVMTGLPGMPEPGSGTVAENLASFIETGLEVLGRVTPAFAGMVSQPGVLSRFHAMVGGDAAFGASADAEDSSEPPGEPSGEGLPAILTGYLRAEQRLARVDAAADIDAAVVLIVGAIHGQVLPRALFGQPGTPAPAGVPSGLALRLAHTMLVGIGPGSGT
jgi:AcrR family transcriptional regulator